MAPSGIKFFSNPRVFRNWLEKNHEKSTELVLGFYKKDSGKKGLGYPEALDEALCFGWIDGVRRSLDALSYSIRFTPRKSKSIWSLVNLRHVERLIKSGRMMPPGLSAHEKRDPARIGIYAFENAAQKLSPTDARLFKANGKAWIFFQKQPAGYQRTASYWVVSSKKEETRSRRLAQLIEDSAKGQKIAPLNWSKSDRSSKVG